jgi:hypothetical protein
MHATNSRSQIVLSTRTAVYYLREFKLIFRTLDMRIITLSLLLVSGLLFFECATNTAENGSTSQPVYTDAPYIQDLSIKYYKTDENHLLQNSWMDRNGVIQVLSAEGLMRAYDGQFLYPGELIPDRTYRPLTDKNIIDFMIVEDQFVYLDDVAVLSNAWAGKLFIRHGLKDVKTFSGNADFEFLISNGKALEFLSIRRVWWGFLDPGREHY